jgi:hypothetical protein
LNIRYCNAIKYCNSGFQFVLVTAVKISKMMIFANGGDIFVAATPEPTRQPALDARCLWCGRSFTPRMIGGSAQKFCCMAHRQQFWIAARRWTMPAIEVDRLKASHTSVHAA